MLARVRSAAVLGIDAYLVEVETDIANGLPTFVTVGLPQGAVKEGRDRVSAVLEAARLRLRPIVMTSIAFIMGVLPLVTASGAGAEVRRAMGAAVFSGMIGVTVFGLLLTPVFFVLLRREQTKVEPATGLEVSSHA